MPEKAKRMTLVEAKRVLADKAPLRMLKVADYASAPKMEAPKERQLTPVEQQLRDLKYYTRRGRDLPKIDADTKRQIDYYILASRNEIEPSTPQLIQQVVVDFLASKPTELVTVGRAWCRYMRPLLAYAFDRLMAEGAYEQVDYLAQHANGTAVAGVLTPQISPVEIGYRKSANVVTQGTYFLRAGTEGMVISFDFEGMSCSISASVPGSKRGVAEAFLDDYSRACAEYNIYKNQHLAMINGGLTFIDLEPVKLSQVLLPAKVKMETVENTLGVLAHREALLKTPMGIKRSVLLAGEPGTGKTALFKAISGAAGECTVIIVSSKAFDSTSDVSLLYAAARDLGPTLLVLEDMDLIGAERNHSRGDNELLGEFLTQMSGTETNASIITLASTNDLSAIDAALANRPGRFDRVIHVPLPGPKTRSQMLKQFLAELDIAVTASPETWKIAVQQMKGFTGSHVKEVAHTCLVKATVEKKAAADGKVTVGDAQLLQAATVVRENFFTAKAAGTRSKAPVQARARRAPDSDDVPDSTR